MYCLYCIWPTLNMTEAVTVGCGSMHQSAHICSYTGRCHQSCPCSNQRCHGHTACLVSGAVCWGISQVRWWWGYYWYIHEPVEWPPATHQGNMTLYIILGPHTGDITMYHWPGILFPTLPVWSVCCVIQNIFVPEQRQIFPVWLEKVGWLGDTGSLSEVSSYTCHITPPPGVVTRQGVVFHERNVRKIMNWLFQLPFNGNICNYKIHLKDDLTKLMLLTITFSPNIDFYIKLVQYTEAGQLEQHYNALG